MTTYLTALLQTEEGETAGLIVLAPRLSGRHDEEGFFGKGKVLVCGQLYRVRIQLMPVLLAHKHVEEHIPEDLRPTPEELARDEIPF